MKLPAKVEIIGIRYKEYDYNELMKGIAGIYRFHHPIMIVETKTVTEGLGVDRFRFTYQYYLCRRRWIGVVLFNMAVAYYYKHFYKLDK